MRHIYFLLFFLVLLTAAPPAFAEQNLRTQVKFGSFYLSLGLLAEDIWVLEISKNEVPATTPFRFSPMLLAKLSISAPPENGTGIWQAKNTKAQLENEQLNIQNSAGDNIISLRPYAPDGQLAGFTFYDGKYQDFYGLGADYRQKNFNLQNTVTSPAAPYGNDLIEFRGQDVSQNQLPVLYALGSGHASVALLADEILPLNWSLAGEPWQVSTAGPLKPEGNFRLIVITGNSLPELRTKLSSLIGRPPVPPQNVFRLWLSGLEGEKQSSLLSRLSDLKNSLDLAGFLFQEPATLSLLPLESLSSSELEIMLAEYPLVEAGLDGAEHNENGFFVEGFGGDILKIKAAENYNLIIDYTNEGAATFWHSLHRKPFMDKGVRLFRLSGEAVGRFGPSAFYKGGDEFFGHSSYAASNRYHQAWARSIAKAVDNERNSTRFFLSSQFGLLGLGRQGAGLYSNVSLFGYDVTSQVRAHLFLSGLDYYSFDYEQALASRSLDNFSQLYEGWLASTVLIDFPLVLPEVLAKHPASKYALKTRAELLPYYYALAYRAHLSGEPILAPLVYYFQDDPGVRTRSFELMLGPNLLISPVWEMGERINTYVPRGRWYNYRTGESFTQETGSFLPMDYKFAGTMGAPILARAGAIIPVRHEIKKMGEPRSFMNGVKIFMADNEASTFQWYSDDGYSNDYLRGQFVRQAIEAKAGADNSLEITIKAHEGLWNKAPSQEQLLIDVYGFNAVAEASLDGMPFNRFANLEDLMSQAAGWASLSHGAIRFKTPPLDTKKDHVLIVK